VLDCKRICLIRKAGGYQIIKIKFLQDAIIQNKFKIDKGDILSVDEFDGYFIVTLVNMRKAIMSKSELGKLFEIVEE
jgi:hypothetical protein